MAKEKKSLDEEAVLLLNKGKRGFFRLIFGRTTIVVLLLAAQFALLFAGFYWMRDYTVYGGSMLLGLVVALIVVNRPKNPYIKITWILLILLFPVFAIPFYFYVDADWGHRLVRARLEDGALSRLAELRHGLLSYRGEGFLRYAGGAGTGPGFRLPGVLHHPGGLHVGPHPQRAGAEGQGGRGGPGPL